VSVENTANKAGGVVYPLDRIEALAQTARDHDLHLHLDGARLWNAAVAHDVPERAYAAPFDLTWVALSKGLGAPAGSVIAGPTPLIEEARRVRKQFGGGMRQAGILAAAGLYALEHHRPHLVDDHEKAQHLAETIASRPSFDLDVDAVETNIIIFEVTDGTAESVVGTLEDEGVLVTPFGPRTVRATTHRDVSVEEVDEAAEIIRGRFPTNS
jgi:threonine aldolase